MESIKHTGWQRDHNPQTDSPKTTANLSNHNLMKGSFRVILGVN